MTLYDYVCNAHRSYSGAERTDIWWENSGLVWLCETVCVKVCN